MKRKLKAAVILPFFIFFMIFFPTFAMAGLDPPGGPGGSGDPACDPQCNCRPDGSICPIDSNLYILLAIGLVYGIKKVKDSRKSPADT
jgi:hypothetical protein